MQKRTLTQIKKALQKLSKKDGLNRTVHTTLALVKHLKIILALRKTICYYEK